jgi:hypothetical protein
LIYGKPVNQYSRTHAHGNQRFPVPSVCFPIPSHSLLLSSLILLRNLQIDRVAMVNLYTSSIETISNCLNFGFRHCHVLVIYLPFLYRHFVLCLPSWCVASLETSTGIWYSNHLGSPQYSEFNHHIYSAFTLSPLCAETPSLKLDWGSSLRPFVTIFLHILD